MKRILFPDRVPVTVNLSGFIMVSFFDMNSAELPLYSRITSYNVCYTKLLRTMKFNLFDGVLGLIDDKDIRLKDLWPTNQEVGEYMQQLDYTLYKQIYKNIFKGNQFWQNLEVSNTPVYNWDA